ncbi:Crp/Fnr family transcriptional regulator [Myxococcota bacterium]|nr:Crp/Fnr family transcriptional regulator [Myxococcota bacterium]
MSEEKLQERLGKAFPVGHILFTEGDVGKEMFVVTSGKIRISKNVRGVETTLVVLGSGEFLGEMSVLNNEPRSATATVAEEAQLLVINPKTFETMLRGNAEIAIRMIKKLSSRLQDTDMQVENLLLKDPNSRVVHFLRNNATRRGTETPDGIVLEISIKDIAGLTGLDVEQVDEVMNKIIRAGLVNLNGQGGLVIKDADKLGQFLDFLEMKEKFGHI